MGAIDAIVEHMLAELIRSGIKNTYKTSTPLFMMMLTSKRNHALLCTLKQAHEHVFNDLKLQVRRDLLVQRGFSGASLFQELVRGSLFHNAHATWLLENMRQNAHALYASLQLAKVLGDLDHEWMTLAFGASSFYAARAKRG